MYTDSGTLLDATVSDLIDLNATAITAHSAVIEEFVTTYKKLREKEIASFRISAKHDIYGDEPKPCLLILVSRHRPVSKAKHIRRYFPNNEDLNLSVIFLAKVSGSFTQHISTGSDQKYMSTKIVRMNELRFQHREQREWMLSTIEQINELNAAGRQLRDNYLSMVNMHYNIHKVAGVLAPANYHFKLKSQ